MPKIHLATAHGWTACMRSNAARTTTTVRQVDCRLCQDTLVFKNLKEADDAARKAAFDAQEPRIVAEPWQRDTTMICKACGHDRFRHADRTCYGHYDNWVCANCGHTESRLTETGMSF